MLNEKSRRGASRANRFHSESGITILDLVGATLRPKSSHKCRSRKSNRQDGFSIIELLIALSVMTVIIGAVLTLVGGSLRFANSTHYMTDAEQGLRASHEILNRDLITVGDGLNGIGTIQVPLGFVQNYLTTAPVVISTNPNYVNLALVTSDDNVPAGTAVPQASPATNVLGGSDRLVLLTEDTSFAAVSLLAGKITVSGSNTTILVSSADVSRFQVGEIYAIVSQSSAAFGVISAINTTSYTLTMTNGDLYGLNQTGAGTPITTVSSIVSGASTQAASIVRIQMIQYYVTANNLLMRRVFGLKGAGVVDSIIAEHVTNLQFRYQTNLAGSSGFAPQPVTQLTSSQQQLAVREVETTIAVESVHAVNVTTNTSSGKQTISTTTTASVRNLQFRQALSP